MNLIMNGSSIKSTLNLTPKHFYHSGNEANFTKHVS